MYQLTLYIMYSEYVYEVNCCQIMVILLVPRWKFVLVCKHSFIVTEYNVFLGITKLIVFSQI